MKNPESSQETKARVGKGKISRGKRYDSKGDKILMGRRYFTSVIPDVWFTQVPSLIVDELTRKHI